MQKKILGLDLGVTSIGWSLISENDNDSYSIIDMGCRIIPLTTEDKDEFSSGNAISKNQKRTIKRTQRKGYKRYQLRRYTLSELLKSYNMMPDERLIKLSSIELYGLRDKALKEKISLQELGRIFYHLNQKRGYKSSRSDANLDKKDTEYVAKVKGRHKIIKENGFTIGQYFFHELQKNKYYKIKEQVFPREAYIEEFDAICKAQQQFYQTELTDSLVEEIRNDIIYFQRKLKSQKGLVSICEFEGRIQKDSISGKDIFVGPKVAPRTSPLFQLCRIWELVNNITLKVKNPEGSKYKWSDYILTSDEKQNLVNHLSINSKLTYTEFLKILKLKKEDVFANKQIQKDLQGNITYSSIAAIIKNEDLLRFNVEINTIDDKALLIDKKTGEVLEERNKQTVNKEIEREPLYQLWHTIYSIKEIDECKAALVKRFGINERDAENLALIDFNKQAFGDKSNKAMRKILPYLMQGFNYAQACSLAGYNHSKSLTKVEQENIVTDDNLVLLPKNSLRQPVVEKILNQMINLINTLIGKYGKPDEIRVELARELKQSKEERNDADKQNSLNKKLNEEISKRITDLKLPATKRNIQKYKFIFPSREKKWNEAQVINQCIYCGETFNLTEALSGDNFDVDHIIPRSLLFDDSQTNKVLVHRKCNANKTNTTAYDYIASKGDAALTAYIERVDSWFKQGVLSYGKMQRLKISYNEYLERKKNKKETEADKKLWENFIDRQLRETAYIARKARQLLKRICNNVYTTEGSITATLRRLWGWDDVLMNLQLPKYKAIGLTLINEWTSEHGKHKHHKEEILNWSKRDDHRHHAIDALVVACTKQGFIQRMNTLNASDVRNEMKKEVEEAKNIYNEKLTLLEQYLTGKKPFNTKQVEEAAAKILVSFKPGKRVATVSKLKAKGKNEIKGVITPRGALSEESVYGKIKSTEIGKKVNYLFENSHLIFKPYIKVLVDERITTFNGDIKKALMSLKKEPIYLDKEKTRILEFGTCYKEEVVMKYPLESLKAKDVKFIVDKKIREIVEERLQQFNNKEKEAFKDLENNPLWFNKEKNIPIKTVRCFTGLQAVEPVKKDINGNNIGFVKPGNNHHIAIYEDATGKKQEHVCSFWHAVERKKYGFPVVISNPKQVWDKILTNKENYPQSFLDKLPEDGLQLQLSMQQNEMFLLGIKREDAENVLRGNDKKIISNYLFLVWSVSENNYWFRHHLETKNSELKTIKGATDSKRFYLFKSIGAFEKENPIKVCINNIGEIKPA
ncbi:MAG: type II CRISPR RNA-guided endonuclease Cas9 [Chitinophagaceae bacterium]|nr:type II CRISPR RNA-guided endonuclease Cas9 [Chitinophagaceae bacterium]